MVDINKLMEDVKTHVVPGPMRDTLLFLLQKEKRKEEDQELALFRERLPGWLEQRPSLGVVSAIKKVARHGTFFFARVHVDGGKEDSYIMLDTNGEFPSGTISPVINMSSNPYWLLYQATLISCYKHTNGYYIDITQELGDLGVAVLQLQED